MPRLNRIRIHNIHFDSGGQSRYYHDTIFEPKGHNSLLLLANGGGKTLLLHLIAQVVLPNVRLQERRISRLLEKEQFTGHVMVEWRLDGEMPDFLLTGFCFADNLGSANRDMDYFNYYYRYSDDNSWDIASIPLVDSEGRNLNFKQMNDLLKDSPVAVYHSYRKLEYQAKLATYNINPREWEHVLKINNSEGGVENFFEGCSKTRTLMNKLLIPMMDEVLERNEQHDTLQDAFRKVARQAIELPELKVQSDALGELSRQIPGLLSAFNTVAASLQQRNNLLERQARIYRTLFTGLPRLERKQRQLAETIAEKGAALERAKFMLEAYAVERYRREWVKLLAEYEKAQKQKETAQNQRDSAQQRFRRLLANQKWELILDKRRGLAECEQQLQKARSGDEAFDRRFEQLKKEALPLLLQCIANLACKEAAVSNELVEHEREAEETSLEISKANALLQEIHTEKHHLTKSMEEFAEERKEAAAYFAERRIDLDPYAPEQGLLIIQAELKKFTDELGKQEVAKNQIEKKLEQLRNSLAAARTPAEKAAAQLQEHDQHYNKWCDEGQELQAELKMQKFPGSFPGPPETVLTWLEQKEKLIQERYLECQREERRWKEQQELFSGNGSPRPNAEVDRVAEILRSRGMAAQPAVDLLKNNAAERRQELLQTRPWLPYAVLVEPAHLKELKRRPPTIAKELPVPVPLISREEFYHGSELQGVYFLSHRGLELFISDEKAGTYRQKILDKLEETSEKIGKLDTDDRAIRTLGKKVDLFLHQYTYASQQQWEKARRDLDKARNQQEQEKDRLENELKQSEQVLKDINAGLDKLKGRKSALERADDYGRRYLKRWSKNEAGRKELKKLQKRKKEAEAALAVLEQKVARQKQITEELKDQIKILQGKRERYDTFSSLHYTEEELAQFAGRGGQPIDEAELDGKMQQINAMHATLQEKQSDVKDLEKRIAEYKKDIADYENTILRFDLELPDVETNYYPVTSEDIRYAKAEHEGKEQTFKKAENECSLADKRAGSAEAVYKDRLQKLDADFPGQELPDLSELVLSQEQERIHDEMIKISREQQDLHKRQDECIKWIEDYDRALGSIKSTSSAFPSEVMPFSEEEEQEMLLGRALVAVDENRQKLEQVGAAMHNYKSKVLTALKACEEELMKLHGENIKRFFRSLHQRTNEDGWEDRIGELQAKLNHALEAIERLQEHVQQQLKNIDQRINEMALRTWRHVDSLLEQLKELHRRAKIELRGEKLNLFKIEFKKPDETEGKAAIKDYLHRMVEEAARRHQQNVDKDEIDQFLNDAVKSAQLLDRVVNLDDISIQLLKPGDYENSYTNKQYDRWDYLNDWSQGQRFAGRFSLFVVLLSYLRHSRSGGRESSSVILADNPFGKASSSHILEIINTIAYYQNVQLFCCTALRNTEIIREFPVIYSLVSTPTMSGKERMLLETQLKPSPQALEQAYAHIPGIKPGDTRQLKLF